MAKSIEGEDFLVTIEGSTQNRISTEKVKELLTPEQLEQVMQSIDITTMRSTRRDASKKPKFVLPNTDNLTPAGLTDMLGDVRERIGLLKKEEELYKEMLKAHLRREEYKEQKDG